MISKYLVEPEYVRGPLEVTKPHPQVLNIGYVDKNENLVLDIVRQAPTSFYISSEFISIMSRLSHQINGFLDLDGEFYAFKLLTFDYNPQTFEINSDLSIGGIYADVTLGEASLFVL